MQQAYQKLIRCRSLRTQAHPTLSRGQRGIVRAQSIPSGVVMEHLRTAAAEAGQEHIFAAWENLSLAERQELLDDVQDVDFKYLASIFKASTCSTDASMVEEATPCNDVLKLQDRSPEDRQSWRKHGLDLLAKGKAAVLLLAGGQGTRLGSSQPKGCYDVGLPSKKSLFQIQAERLLKLQQLAAEHLASSTTEAGQSDSLAGPVPLQWYIMTSPFTHEETVAHFEKHGYFGLHEGQVHFFQQGFLPCLTEEGKIIMETHSRLAKAPDGNGGIYRSLHRSGCLDHMSEQGIECLDVYCVDNILARLGDPLFLGYCHRRNAEVGARVVAKAYPEERVGVFAKRGSALTVLEYSELDPAVASAADPATGTLIYNWSNICMHYFSTEWLQRVQSHLKEGSAYHVAKKKIPSTEGPVPGIKLELFIFDIFPLAAPGKVALMEVTRAAEFAPVKNAPGSATDSPDTARAAVLALHKSWVEAAGGNVLSPEGVEVAPCVSYAGEGLQAICSGRSFASSHCNELLGLGPS